jgi:hypothetical protein
MRDLLEAEFTTVDQVAAALEGVESFCLPARDRRGVFATAYLQITRAIGREILAGRFHDAEWTTRYLISFGNHYRLAFLACDAGKTELVPKAWRIAFDATRGGKALVIQHLILGINAHINYDLAVTLNEVGIDPDRQLRYEDHTLVNEVLEATTAQLKRQVSTMYAPILQRLDWLAGRLDDDLTRFSIPHARDHAWSQAVALTGARSAEERDRLLRSLDAQAAVIATMVLTPTTRHPILLRVARLAERIDAVLMRMFDRSRG